MACEQGMHQLFCFGALGRISMKTSTGGGPPAAAATLWARSRSMSVTAKVEPRATSWRVMPSPIILRPPVRNANGILVLVGPNPNGAYGAASLAWSACRQSHRGSEARRGHLPVYVADHLLEGVCHVGPAAEFGVDQGINAPGLAAKRLFRREPKPLSHLVVSGRDAAVPVITQCHWPRTPRRRLRSK